MFVYLLFVTVCFLFVYGSFGCRSEVGHPSDVHPREVFDGGGVTDEVVDLFSQKKKKERKKGRKKK